MENHHIEAHLSKSLPCPGCNRESDRARCEWCGAALEVGIYRVEQVLSQTQHSRVYAARGPDGVKVALKELLFSTVPSISQIDAFEREGSLLQSLVHPGLARFVGCTRVGEGVGLRMYLATELIDGESLRQRLSKGPLDPDALLALAQNLLQTLVFLQNRSRAVVHRDIKPENIIYRKVGARVLVHLGSARALDEPVTYSASLSVTVG